MAGAGEGLAGAGAGAAVGAALGVVVGAGAGTKGAGVPGAVGLGLAGAAVLGMAAPGTKLPPGAGGTCTLSPMQRTCQRRKMASVSVEPNGMPEKWKRV